MDSHRRRYRTDRVYGKYTVSHEWFHKTVLDHVDLRLAIAVPGTRWFFDPRMKPAGSRTTIKTELDDKSGFTFSSWNPGLPLRRLLRFRQIVLLSVDDDNRRGRRTLLVLPDDLNDIRSVFLDGLGVITKEHIFSP